MAFRGRGRGGRGGFGGGGFGRGPPVQPPFEYFPEIEGLGTAPRAIVNKLLIKWSKDLEEFSKTSPYYYEDKKDKSKRSVHKKRKQEFDLHLLQLGHAISEILYSLMLFARGRSWAEGQKQDIERYSDRRKRAAQDKQPLRDIMKLDTDHMPAELTERRRRPVSKRIRWTAEADQRRIDMFEKLEKKSEGEEGTEKKENEEEEEEEEGLIEEDDGEFSDEGDYEQAEYFDDDEDDYNMADDGDDDEGTY